jgi:nucleotide-binding universal stress UspA family protein
MFQPRVILHPTDYSDCARYAFAVALDLARLHQASLLVLHVAETLGAESLTYGEAASQLQPTAFQRRLLEELRHVTAPAAEAGVPVQHLLAEGDPPDEILRVTKEHACDLIVMGTHGRSALARLLMGSITEKVVRRAPCPLVIVKLPGSVS